MPCRPPPRALIGPCGQARMTRRRHVCHRLIAKFFRKQPKDLCLAHSVIRPCCAPGSHPPAPSKPRPSPCPSLPQSSIGLPAVSPEETNSAMKRSAPTSAPSSPTKRLNLACGSPSEPTDETYIYKNSAYGSDIPSVYAAPGYPDYLNLILTARVYDVASETPLQPAHNLSLRIKNNIYLKREDLQPVFSFKLRGAYNRMQQLSEEEKKRGVIACSAGNHAQGVALSATKMGIKATIVMPLATPPIKWRNVKRLGAEVVLFGNDFDEAKTEAARLQQERGLTNIPPYDDPYVIAGQGTIGVELLRQASFGNIDAIFVCVGGGGLAAGVASYIKRLNPSIKIIGVETLDAAGMTTSILAKKRVTLPQVGLFADGAAVRLVGEETFRICEQLLDEMILVSTDEICAAIKDVFEDTRSVLEPAGALSVAGAKKYIQAHGCEGKNFITICSGANMNFDRLRFVAERADLGENKEALISVVIPEQPGSFLTLHSVIHPRSVTEFSYRYGDAHEAHIFMSFVVNDRDAELKQIFAELQALGMRAMDASHNELAKAHARYLVGGRKEVPHERIFRFSFPERPGALNHFLNSVKCPLWNISLFHYRNYGGDVGKVVVGLQVPPDSQADFETFLGELKYPYVEETNNKVYRLTLNAGFAN